jgi:hypothetical protein
MSEPPKEPRREPIPIPRPVKRQPIPRDDWTVPGDVDPIAWPADLRAEIVAQLAALLVAAYRRDHGEQP